MDFWISGYPTLHLLLEKMVSASFFLEKTKACSCVNTLCTYEFGEKKVILWSALNEKVKGLKEQFGVHHFFLEL
jgi:hypothetical protein